MQMTEASARCLSLTFNISEKNMGFNLFGFDIVKQDQLFGFWLVSFKLLCINERQRNLLSVYYCDGDWFFDLFWLHII